jgi:hypothetical protein
MNESPNVITPVPLCPFAQAMVNALPESRRSGCNGNDLIKSAERGRAANEGTARLAAERRVAQQRELEDSLRPRPLTAAEQAERDAAAAYSRRYRAALGLSTATATAPCVWPDVPE